MTFPLLTERLELRPFDRDDAPDLFAVFGDPDVMRLWNSKPLRDLAEAQEVLERFGLMQAEHGFSPWRVGSRAGGLIGSVGLQPLGDDEVEIIFALLPKAWGRGFATEAGMAALAAGFRGSGLREIVGIAKAENQASIRVLQRLGMRHVGEATYFDKPWVKYTMDRDDWRSR